MTIGLVPSPSRQLTSSTAHNANNMVEGVTSASTKNIKLNKQDISSGLESEPEFCSDFQLCCGETYIPVCMYKFTQDISAVFRMS